MCKFSRWAVNFLICRNAGIYKQDQNTVPINTFCFLRNIQIISLLFLSKVCLRVKQKICVSIFSTLYITLQKFKQSLNRLKKQNYPPRRICWTLSLIICPSRWINILNSSLINLFIFDSNVWEENIFIEIGTQYSVDSLETQGWRFLRKNHFLCTQDINLVHVCKKYKI